ncbi:MAG: DUF1273 family protein [Clostridia bacterium]|nr:DUF1273 family protein [Clostridia bacterium]
MKDKVCCFTGHREVSEEEIVNIKQKTKKEVITLIENGVVYFCAGGARGFDTFAAEIVLELKKQYPNIKLILILPCVNQTMGWKEADKEKYNYIKNRADEVKILSQSYYSGCMHVRNRFMVDNSAYCICYFRKGRSGTSYTVNYAIKRKVNIIYI